jgi:NADPH:quinone reductase-like Zn-dependent oxidoreductase
VVGGPRKNRLLGPLGHVVRTKAGALVTSQSATFFVARLDKAKLETIRDLLARGELRSVIDSTFGLEDVARALEHQGSGHPRGKIVVAV